MAEDKDKVAPARDVKAAAAPLPDTAPVKKDEFSNKSKYESGVLYDMSLDFYQKHNDSELEEFGYSKDQIAVAHEALKFHGLEAGALRDERLAHQAAVLKEGESATEAQ